LFWRPFDQFFDEFLDDFRYHADLVNRELLLAQMWETKEGKASIATQLEDIKRRLANTESDRKNRDSLFIGLDNQEEYARYVKG
jgi:hypothetical protein